MTKPRLLWIGDAVVHTGFATVTHSILDHLKDDWDIHVLGVNYCGDPHEYPYKIYPAMVNSIKACDQLGLKRCPTLLDKIRPDIVCMNNDPWNVAELAYSTWRIGRVKIPLVAYMPVDSRHMNEQRMRAMSPDAEGFGLSLAIWYTDFAKREAEAAGYTGKSVVIPHGVDCERFYPTDRDECRRELGFPASYEGKFIIGNVNRNQFRKRQDLMFEYIGEWVGRNEELREKVVVYCHCPGSHPEGWDLPLLGNRYRLRNGHSVKSSFEGVPPEAMAKVYGAFDVQVSTTLGEGWGLTTHEGLACGVPEIYPDFAALGEWVPRINFGTWAVPTDAKLCYNGTHHVGEAPDREAFVDALDDAYNVLQTDTPKGRMLRRERIADAVRPHNAPQWQWENIAARFDTEFRKLLYSDTTPTPADSVTVTSSDAEPVGVA